MAKKKANFDGLRIVGEMIMEVCNLADEGESTFDALRIVGEKYHLTSRQNKILEKIYGDCVCLVVTKAPALSGKGYG